MRVAHVTCARCGGGGQAFGKVTEGRMLYACPRTDGERERERECARARERARASDRARERERVRVRD